MFLLAIEFVPRSRTSLFIVVRQYQNNTTLYYDCLYRY